MSEVSIKCKLCGSVYGPLVHHDCSADILATIAQRDERIKDLQDVLQAAVAVTEGMSTQLAEMTRERDEAIEDGRIAMAMGVQLHKRALAAEAIVDRYKVALEMIVEKSSHELWTIARDALTGTEPGE